MMSKTMTVPRVDRQTFLQRLVKSGLLTEKEISELEPRLPETGRGKVLARALVDLEILTRFQAERLLGGRTQGFILGRYIILDQLGQGGMGKVLKARHRTMNRVVALKVLNTSLDSERAQELFLREVHAAAQLVHPNIVTAFDADHDGDRYYLVMELIDGPDLDRLVKQQGPLDVGQACDFMRQAAVGLQCAHAQGMVHRDIKPANILVQRRGAEGDQAPGLVKISDFGLARLHEPVEQQSRRGTIVTRPNTVMGTPDFLSPEQARNLHKTDIRSDLYSLGCTFYYLLTGRVPFSGGTAMEKLIRHSTDKPEPVNELREEVPEGVAAIVHKLLEKHPDDRYQVPADLAEALAPFSVSGPTPWEPVRPPSDELIEVELTPDNSSEVLDDPLFGTAPGSAGQTPLVQSSRDRVRTLQHRDADASRLKRVILVTLGIVGGLLCLALILQAVFG